MKLFRISTVPMSLNLLLKGQLRFLNGFYDVTAISGAGKDLDEVREREGVKTKTIQIERQISPLKDIISLIKLYHYFKKEKPDIIHSITPKAGLLSMVAGKMAGVPIRIHTFTGLIFPHKEGHFQTLLIWMDRMLCRFATHIYPEGNGVKQDLLEHHITKKPLKIIANGNVNGIDLDFFKRNNISENEKNSLRKNLGITPDDFVFIFVGRLVKDKGINELVAAFKALSNQQSENGGLDGVNKRTDPQTSKLLLVGTLEQHLDPLLPETIFEIENNPLIISVGFKEDVRSYFAISNALIFPSYREGFPNVVLQSLAMEVPAVVTEINGCKEIIKDHDNGIVVPPKNAEQLQLAMTKMVNDNSLYQNLQQNTRESIQKFNQNLVWEELLKEYRKIAP